MMIVTGPSLTRATFMSAPNLPVSTRAPSARNSATTASTSGSATAPGDALFQVGRRPLAVSAYSLNWLTTRSGAFRSEQDFSPSRMRRPQSLAASFLAFSAVSSWVTPTRTRSPGPSIAPMTAPSTRTLASLTRCATARMGSARRDLRLGPAGQIALRPGEQRDPVGVGERRLAERLRRRPAVVAGRPASRAGEGQGHAAVPRGAVLVVADPAPHADRDARGHQHADHQVHDPLPPRGERDRARGLVGAEAGLAVGGGRIVHDRPIVRAPRRRADPLRARCAGVTVCGSVAATERASTDTEVTEWLPVTPLGLTEPPAGWTWAPATSRRRSRSTPASSAGRESRAAPRWAATRWPGSAAGTSPGSDRSWARPAPRPRGPPTSPRPTWTRPRPGSPTPAGRS